MVGGVTLGGLAPAGVKGRLGHRKVARPGPGDLVKNWTGASGCAREVSRGRNLHRDTGVVGEGRIRATWGWISVDRGSKATLPLTMPRRVFKSSAKDSARRPSGISLQGGRVAVPPRWPYLRHVPVGVHEHPYRGSGGSRRAQAPLF